MTDNNDFFASLKPFTDFSEVFDQAHYRSAPDEWLVVVADIQGSTEAIGKGRYKDVNVVGASAIAAVLNAAGDTDLPFVFGGDGASFLVPAACEERIMGALAGVRTMAAQSFGLSLRAGRIAVRDIKAAGHDVRVARYSLSPKLAIAMFDGGGLPYAEHLVKTGNSLPSGAAGGTPAADFSGLECRWNPIKSVQGEILTLIVQARDTGHIEIYRDLFHYIQELCGAKEDYRPVGSSRLRLSFRREFLRQEALVRSHGRPFPFRLAAAAKIRLMNFIGMLIFALDIRTSDVDGRSYLNDVSASSDFQKFDNMLRMVIDIAPGRIEKLTRHLEEEYRQGKIYYGLHRGREALMTCLVFDRRDRHIHFIDGARGGYASAAAALKAQIRSAAV